MTDIYIYIIWELKTEKHIVLNIYLGACYLIFDSSHVDLLNLVTGASICGCQLRCSCNRKARYLTVVVVFVLSPLILKLRCLVIVFPLDLNNKISVLLELRLILFDRNY